MDDERDEELTTLSAIYSEFPDEYAADPSEAYTFHFKIHVAPELPVTVQYPAVKLPTPPHSDDGEKSDESIPALRDQHVLEHLPSLQLKVELPSGYPAECPPNVTLSTSPSWLSPEKISELEAECRKLWEEYGQCQIVYTYVSSLQEASERLFDIETPLVLSPNLKPEMLEFDGKTRKAVFDKETFDCGVCMEPKKGVLCNRLPRCGHVFCRACLRDFYNNAITEGDVVNVRCIDPDCGIKEEAGNGRRRTTKHKTLHARELLDIGIEEAQVKRYIEMKRKKKLESDKSTIYCPRTWCQAPARSQKTAPIPEDLRLYVDSDDSDTEGGAAPKYDRNTPDHKLPAPADRLAICSNPKCLLAFCRVCYQGWHGEFARCWPRKPTELTAEEKASYDYIRLHTSPCPTCSSPVQKTMGCNHMNCAQCQTHFCYLCGAWLDAGNPYLHFNTRGSTCYQRLWELEEGDNGDGQVQFVGPRYWEAEAQRIAEEADREEAERLQAEENQQAGRAPVQAVAVADDDAHDAELQEALLEGNMRFDQMRLNQAPQARVHGAALNARQDAQAPGVVRPRRHPDMAHNVDPAHGAAFRRFVEMAARDEEDEWDSDEVEDEEAWVIRVR